LSEHAQRNYFKLDAAETHSTASLLQRRIEERFPGCGLSSVATEVATVTQVTGARVAELSRPFWPLRITSLLLLGLTLVSLLYGLIFGVNWTNLTTQVRFADLIGVIEPTFGTSVWVGAFWVFTWSLETRWKHRRILEAINELRSLIHVVDMHQLTKDPERAKRPGPDTASSPTRRMTTFELGRYLDYCSELLSIISKVAVLYGQSFPDTVILGATDQVESLASGLSRKIWQKLVLLEADGSKALPRG
jgi:hypothetical protein